MGKPLAEIVKVDVMTEKGSIFAAAAVIFKTTAESGESPVLSAWTWATIDKR